MTHITLFGRTETKFGSEFSHETTTHLNVY